MKQIHEAVRTLENAIGFWRPSWILMKKLKNAKKLPGKFPSANMHRGLLQIFGNNPSRGFQVRAETKCGGGGGSGGRTQQKQ